jgi:radical SAM protein with 4Fe4S-binding SPASM domain
MNYYLDRYAVLKWLEIPSVYQIKNDELYELDGNSFAFFKSCMSETGCTTEDGAFIDYCKAEMLIARGHLPVKRPLLVRSPDPSLRYLELQITNTCNLRCKHCYIGDRSHNELSLKQIENSLREFEAMQGLRVLVTGGEPLLHTKFGAVNEMLSDFMVRKVLFTNGVALKKDDLTGLNVEEIQVSIDGLEEGHDALRGAGTFNRSMEAVRDALEAGFDVSIATMALPGNLRDFDEMESLFKGMGIKDWTVDIPCMIGRLREHAEFHMKPEKGGRYLAYGYGAGLHGTGQGFGCGLHLMSVLADGRAAKCTFYADRAVGTVEQGLRACWERVQPVRLETLECDCEYLDVCRGGCRYRAELLDGKNGRDLYRCALYGILSEKV